MVFLVKGALVGDRTGDPASLAWVNALTGQNTSIMFNETFSSGSDRIKHRPQNFFAKKVEFWGPKKNLTYPRPRKKHDFLLK